MNILLHITDLFVSVAKKQIINSFNLFLNAGETHAIMGPNGSGKSSLAYALMGHPKYATFSGDILFLGESIKKMSADQRARKGLFLAFQYPVEIPGATVFSVLKGSYGAITEKLVPVISFSNMLFSYMDMLQIDRSFAYRNLNEGFSGGEKKKFEMLQLLLLKPKVAILDEIDSGLDVDALEVVSKALLQAKKENPHMGIIIITHYARLFRYIKPDMVHIMDNGCLVKSGNYTLVQTIEETGYNGLVNEK